MKLTIEVEFDYMEMVGIALMAEEEDNGPISKAQWGSIQPGSDEQAQEFAQSAMKLSKWILRSKLNKHIEKYGALEVNLETAIKRDLAVL